MILCVISLTSQKSTFSACRRTSETLLCLLMITTISLSRGAMRKGADTKGVAGRRPLS